jgi:hypothetical protein
MAEVTSAGISKERKKLHEAVVSADFGQGWEIFKAAFMIADNEAMAKILAILCGDLINYLLHRGI